ncbi:MAG: twin-arginine translocase subunit TatB [Acidobacteria bacterium]|nr:MAG: twin-arginine translocase subunit TatB [Acidobacteriota bacterium]RLE23134.1 MAG: twin-arginine translocase subunit TatB [Acidobacteriota bacterium]
MFGMGIGELLLIFVIALIVFGPEKLPTVARTVGKVARDLKRTTDELTETIQREVGIDEIQSTLDLPAEVRKNVRNLVMPPDEVARRRKEKLKEIELVQAKRALEEASFGTDEERVEAEKEERKDKIDG